MLTIQQAVASNLPVIRPQPAAISNWSVILLSSLLAEHPCGI